MVRASRARSRALRSSARLLLLVLGLRLGRVEGAAGVAQVDVVERRAGDGDRGHVARRRPRAPAGRTGRRGRRRRRAPGATRARRRRSRARRRRARAPRADLAVVGCRRRARPRARRRAARALSSSGVPSRDDLAPIDDRQLRGEPVGLLEVVGGEQDRSCPARRPARAISLPHVGPHLGVEAGGRLVEEEHAAAGGRAPWRCRAAAPSRPSTCARSGRRPRSRPKRVEQLVDPRLELARRACRRPGPAGAGSRAPVASRSTAGLLGDDADRAPHRVGLAHDVVAGDASPCPRRPAQRGEDLHRRRLAGAVRAPAGRTRSRPAPGRRCRRGPAPRPDISS